MTGDYIIIQKDGNVYISFIEANKKKDLQLKAIKHKGLTQFVWDEKKYKYYIVLALLWLFLFLIMLYIVKDVKIAFTIMFISIALGVLLASKHLTRYDY